MQDFMNDFYIFWQVLFSGVQSIWNWVFNTTIGEILIFSIIISIVISFIYYFKKLKDNR